MSNKYISVKKINKRIEDAYWFFYLTRDVNFFHWLMFEKNNISLIQFNIWLYRLLYCSGLLWPALPRHVSLIYTAQKTDNAILVQAQEAHFLYMYNKILVHFLNLTNVSFVNFKNFLVHVQEFLYKNFCCLLVLHSEN